MSVHVPSEKILIRDYLGADPGVLSVLGSPERVVTAFDEITDGRHWIVFSRAGGRWDPDVPIMRPLYYMAGYGQNRWEALRSLWSGIHALNLTDPESSPRLEGMGVIVTDMTPDAGISEGLDDLIEGVDRVPYAMLPVSLTVHLTGA